MKLQHELVQTNVEDAKTLIKTLFDPDDYITLSGKKSTRVVGNNVLTQFGTAREFVTTLDDEILGSMCSDPEPMDIYFGISPIRKDSYRGVYKRTKEEDVECVRVLYADLDIKNGCFANSQEAWDFLVNLPYIPTVIVGSGSGGLHAYWKFERSVDVAEGKTLLTRWWSYLSSEAKGRKIDKLVDVTRMSRLPGTVRWPKEGTSETAKAVKLLWASRERVIPVSKVYELSEDPWNAQLQKREGVRNRENSVELRMGEILGSGGWSQKLAIASVESWVAENVTWENVLAPKGWTFLRTDGNGRDEWARPGQGGKSCVVNWPDSPDVMSLLSTSEETGLFDLLDAEIPLTKWRVLVRLWFDDDVTAAVNWVLQCRGLA